MTHARLITAICAFAALLTVLPTNTYCTKSISHRSGRLLQATPSNTSAPGTCPDSQWRHFSDIANATPNAEFKPEKVSYYRQNVQPRLYPFAVVPAAALLLLIIFILWRFLRMCCRCCCHWCCVVPTKDPIRKLRGWTMLEIKISGAAFAIAILVLCAYGMAVVRTDTLDRGFQTVDTVKAYMSSVFDVVDGAVVEAKRIGPVISEATTIINRDVNTTDILGSIACLRPWLDTLIDPATIKAQLMNLYSTIHSKLVPQLGLLIKNTASLAAELPLLQKSTATTSTAGQFLRTFLHESNDFIYAVGNLSYSMPTTPPASDLPELSSALQALMPLSADVSESNNIAASLVVLQAAINSTLLQDSLNELTALTAITADLRLQQVPQLAADLTAVDIGYRRVQPCIVHLLVRVAHINATVVVLPVPILSATRLLTSAKNALDGFVFSNSSTSPSQLAIALRAEASLLVMPPEAATAMALLKSTLASLRSVPDLSNGITLFRDLSNGINTTDAYVQRCSTSLDAYLAAPALSKSARYTEMHQLCEEAAGAMQQIVKNIGPGPLAAIDAAASTAAHMNTVLANSPDLSKMSASLQAVQLLVSGMPAFSQYMVLLDPAIAAFKGLPSPRSKVLDGVSTTVRNLASKAKSGIASLQWQINKAIVSINNHTSVARRNTVGRISTYEAKYRKPANKYNKWQIDGTYCFFAIMILVTLLCVLSLALNHQWLTVASSMLLLIILVVFSVVALAGVAVLSVGNDGCTNFEAQVVTRINSRIHSPAGRTKALALANYYLHNEGGNFSTVAKVALGFNIDATVAKINSTRAQLQTKISAGYILRPPLLAVAVAVDGIVESLVEQIKLGEQFLSYERVHPLYVGLKSFACCEVMTQVGKLWFCIWLASIFGVLLAVTMFAFLDRLESLPQRGCCGCVMRSADEFSSRGAGPSAWNRTRKVSPIPWGEALGKKAGPYGWNGDSSTPREGDAIRAGAMIPPSEPSMARGTLTGRGDSADATAYSASQGTHALNGGLTQGIGSAPSESGSSFGTSAGSSTSQTLRDRFQMGGQGTESGMGGGPDGDGNEINRSSQTWNRGTGQGLGGLAPGSTGGSLDMLASAGGSTNLVMRSDSLFAGAPLLPEGSGISYTPAESSRR